MMAPSWDAVLEKALSEAEAALDDDDFEAALACLEPLELVEEINADTLSWERIRALRERHTVVGERMRSAQGRLSVAMATTADSRRAVRAYSR